MKIHEYQAKQLLGRHGLPVPLGIPVLGKDTLDRAIQDVIGTSKSQTVVVKAQIHAGGRGKGGGVKVVKGAEAARQAAGQILGMRLVTHQTGPEGRVVKRLLVEEGVSIARELYAGILVDRGCSRVVVMVSAAGGMEIEEVAARTPEAIVKEHVDPALGLAAFQARKLSYALGLTGTAARNATSFLQKLYQAFVALDASLVEVNPLVVTSDERVLALDCKMTFDDNALDRHPEVAALRDLDEEDPSETEARSHDLNFIKLDGSIGCMVNGAGLAMATMDIIKHFGASPANFLDVGGGATQAKVTAAFKILTADKDVRGIFVNIFGGIMKCDVIAAGIVGAVAEVGLHVPLVVRLAGTNVEQGTKILAESGLPITTASDMADGARKVVALVKVQVS
ncbi:MAG TPA: ADP-forming succinate--CoA ligase subunit beta [Polyangia bacterium]|jgi:succinyl-CoA synthetase, beta subunit|nr:ADP-forming succinate--CoA ligase subunit beta [Polyangia bacterium]